MKTSDEQALFELKHISFAYPFEQPVLKDVSLSIHAGEMVAILGVNGCGKSTLLKMLAGILCPQEGEFKAFGRVMTEKMLLDDKLSKQYHQRVGFIFQDSDVQLFCSTVQEEIAFGLLQLGMPDSEIKERMHDVMALLSIEHLKDKTPFKLSGGEKKKVAIAAILVMNPDILILDEPTNGLDPRTQRWLVGLLLSLNKAGKTLITSTHNLELVQEISQRAILFDEHHSIVADLPTANLLTDTKLLIDVNLVDEYYHRHESGEHSHYHIHN
ncbi:MAG: ABC transporter ATP-binding protein [Hyphomonadaceae bacterium]|nr:ABC transporter ATP-binding protein [Clostridia bacterium]